MNKKRSLAAAMASAMALAAASALAQEPGAYLGASIGEGKFRKTCDFYEVGTCDPGDTAYRLYGGYHFGPNAALEVGYGRYGDLLVNATSVIGLPAAFEATVKALDVSFVPAYRFSERFGIFGRIGVYRSQVEVHGFGPTPGEASDHNTGLTWGGGLRFHFGNKIAVRAEYQRLDDVGGSRTGEENIDYLSLGLEMAF